MESRQELKQGRNIEAGELQKPWRSAAYFFGPHDFLGLFTYRPKVYQSSDGITTTGWALPHQSQLLSKEIPYWLAYSLVFGGIFLIEISSSSQVTLIWFK